MFSEQVIAGIIDEDDSRCGMSDVAFRTAPPIGEFSCFNISETNRASNFKIYRKVAIDNLYILPEMTSQSTSRRQQIA